MYEGPPFKFMDTAKTHDRFVNAVAHSPDGSRFFSASSDMTLAVCEGKEGKPLVEAKVHAGSIFGAAWSPDSTQIVTASGDKSVKLLNSETLVEVKSVPFESTVGEMQLGCAWGASAIVSYSLGGTLTMMDPKVSYSPPLSPALPPPLPLPPPRTLTPTPMHTRPRPLSPPLTPPLPPHPYPDAPRHRQAVRPQPSDRQAGIRAERRPSDLRVLRGDRRVVCLRAHAQLGPQHRGR